MKIKLLIATADSDYAEHLSNVLTEKYSETFEVSVCSSSERLRGLLASGRHDAALLEQSITFAVNLDSILLPLMLIDESEIVSESGLKHIRKYQRVSAIVGNVLENYAEVSMGISSYSADKAKITAVWSPSGGSGKTTVALAFAAHKVLSGKQSVYLSLENFSSASAYFQEVTGKSISKVFEKLDSNVQMFLMGIRQQDSGSGISYFCGPENYDDMNILTADDIETLVGACAAGVDELIVDMSSQCDERVKKVFGLADTVLIVCDPSSTSQGKLRQFINQHNVLGQIRDKAVLVNNKGAKKAETYTGKSIQLPLLQSADPISVFKTLSGGNFDW